MVIIVHPWKIHFELHKSTYTDFFNKHILHNPQLAECMDVKGFPGGTGGKEPACQCRRHKTCRFDPWIGKIPWRRKWQPTPIFLPGESHGQRSLVGYSPWGHKELDTTERLSTHAYTSQSESAGCTGFSKIKIELLTSLKRWFFKVLIITQRSLKMQSRESAQLPTCKRASSHTHTQRILEKD